MIVFVNNILLFRNEYYFPVSFCQTGDKVSYLTGRNAQIIMALLVIYLDLLPLSTVHIMYKLLIVMKIFDFIGSRSSVFFCADITDSACEFIS